MKRAITAAILLGGVLLVGACDYPGVERSAGRLDPSFNQGREPSRDLRAYPLNSSEADHPGLQGSTRPGGIAPTGVEPFR